MSNRLKCLAAGVILSGFICPVFAASPQTEAPSPNPSPDADAPTGDEKPAKDDRVVVVTATRTETELEKSTASATVVDRGEIEARQYRNVAEAVGQSAGVTLASTGTPGQSAGVFTRGTKTSDTLVLVDGRRLPFNLAGSYNLENFTLDNVDRIEVVRGPLSSAQGGSANGGVINIITRGGKGLEKPEHTVSFEGGSFQTFREIATSRGAFGPFDYSIETSRLDTENQRDNNQYRQNSLSAKPGVQISRDVYADMLFLYNNADIGTPGAIQTNDPDDNLVRETSLISPRVTWDTTEWWQQSVVYSHAQQRQAATGFTGFFNPSNRIQIDTDQLDYQSTFKPFDVWTLVAGGSLVDSRYYRYNDQASMIDVQNNITTTAVFLQSQWDVLDNWRLDSAVRLDHNSDFGNPVTWRVGTLYRVPRLGSKIHASYGTAFSAPTPQDIAASLFGNPDVKAEKSQGYEAGIEQPFWEERVSIGATYFHNRSTNQIIFDPATFVLSNIGLATNEGWEITLKARPCNQVDLVFNYTNLNALDRTNAVRLVRRPMHKIDASVAYRPIPAVTLTGGLTYVADREDYVGFNQAAIEDYFVTRLTASWDINPHVQLFGRIENLNGDQYEEVYGFPALDTGVYAGVKATY